jgi:O-antigen ligase
VVVPAVVAVAVLLAPASTRERFTSIVKPHQGATDSNEHRRVTWRTGVNIIEHHPWFGLGPEGVKYHFKEYVPADIKQLPEGWYGHLHNIYLQFAAERGIPTMLILMWMLVKIVWDFWRRLRKLPPGLSDARFVLQGAIAVWLATMVGGVFEHNLGDSEVLTMFLVVVAAGYIAVETPDESREGAAVA